MKLNEIYLDDAPYNLNNDESWAYASGYNACVDEANEIISDLKESFRKHLQWTRHMLKNEKGWTDEQFDDVFHEQLNLVKND